VQIGNTLNVHVIHLLVHVLNALTALTNAISYRHVNGNAHDVNMLSALGLILFYKALDVVNEYQVSSFCYDVIYVADCSDTKNERKLSDASDAYILH
jgi:hypothetical protein